MKTYSGADHSASLGFIPSGGITGQVLKKESNDACDVYWADDDTGSSAWGGITGTLANQTDLQSALDGKQASGTYATGTGTASGTNTGDQTISDATISTTDITTNNATTAKHGFMPKGTGSTTTFFRSDMTQATPAGGSEAFPVGAVFIAVVSTDPGTLLGYGTWSAIAAGKVLVGLDSGDTDFDVVEETGGAKTVTLDTTMIPAHTHTQDVHTHTQNSHNHTQDAHTHTQNAHNHSQRYHSATTGPLSGPTTTPDTSSNTPTNYGLVTADATAVNQNATATNQAATATNQNATATNQNTGGGLAHSNVQPYFVVYMWKRTA